MKFMAYNVDGTRSPIPGGMIGVYPTESQAWEACTYTNHAGVRCGDAVGVREILTDDDREEAIKFLIAQQSGISTTDQEEIEFWVARGKREPGELSEARDRAILHLNSMGV